MKLNIRHIQGALFWGCEQCYDPEAGHCYAVADMEEKECRRNRKLIRIPLFSIAPICQRYLNS